METSTTFNKDLVQGLDGHETLPVIEDDWAKILTITLPESCVIRTSLSSSEHREVVEICISSFTRISKFTECTITSRPCCAGSDLAGQLKV